VKEIKNFILKIIDINVAYNLTIEKKQKKNKTKYSFHNKYELNMKTKFSINDNNNGRILNLMLF